MAKPKNEKYGAMDGFFEEGKPNDSGYEKKGYNAKSLENLRPRESGTATPKAYMQINIYGYEDYIYRMSKVKNQTMTGYVLDLIKKDMEENREAYEGLKHIKELDKPARVPKNTKKSK